MGKYTIKTKYMLKKKPLLIVFNVNDAMNIELNRIKKAANAAFFIHCYSVNTTSNVILNAYRLR